jgi:hypothetical protein
MAGPHVVGVIALIWSARPTLSRNIAATKTLLQNSANPAVGLASTQTCGGTPSTQIPNNSFGYGRVDALAAYNASAPTSSQARISGQILTGGGQPVPGTTVTISGGPQVVRAITDNTGTYNVEGLPVGNLYMVTPSRANYTFSPGNRSFALQADKTDAAFTATAAVPDANPLDSPEFFVRQQYLDVLSREPEQAGLDFWSGQIRACNTEASCVNAKRIAISEAFFVAQEFQLTGSYIYDSYAGALGRRPAYSEYAADRQQVVGGANLDAAKLAFARGFVQRAEFATKYQANTTAASFVDAVIQSVQLSGVDLNSERQNLIDAYDGQANTIDSRAAVLSAVADNAVFKQSQYNAAFVLTEYFSYLRRDAEPAGFDFWFNVLSNGAPGNYTAMVCAFVTAAEYQNRFSPVVTHTNSECGP